MHLRYFQIPSIIIILLLNIIIILLLLDLVDELSIMCLSVKKIKS